MHRSVVEVNPALMADLVRRQVAMIATPASIVAALAAKAATGTIPIVIVASDPVGLGLVTSLARPGGNVTGLSYFHEALIAKRLQLLGELVPGLVRVAVLRNPTVAMHAMFWQDSDVAARKLGVALQPLEVRGPEDFEAAFAAATQGNAQALIQSLDDGSVGLDSRFLYRLRAFGRRTAAKVSRCIIRTNDQHRSNQLSDECFSCRKHRKPKTHPGRHVAAQ